MPFFFEHSVMIPGIHEDHQLLTYKHQELLSLKHVSLIRDWKDPASVCPQDPTDETDIGGHYLYPDIGDLDTLLLS